jgi:hypothetical protein
MGTTMVGKPNQTQTAVTGPVSQVPPDQSQIPPVPSSGRAEPTPTLVSGHPQFANGKLEACELEYYTAIQDFDYRQGGLTAVLGSVSVRMGKRDLGGLIKLVLKDWNASDQTFTDPPRPASIGFVANNGMSIIAPDTILDSEAASGKLAVYSLAKLPSMMKEIMSGSISLSFSRERGAMDVIVPIDLSSPENVGGEHSQKALDNFLKCLSILTRDVRDSHQ